MVVPHAAWPRVGYEPLLYENISFRNNISFYSLYKKEIYLFQKQRFQFFVNFSERRKSRSGVVLLLLFVRKFNFIFLIELDSIKKIFHFYFWKKEFYFLKKFKYNSFFVLALKLYFSIFSASLTCWKNVPFLIIYIY